MKDADRREELLSLLRQPDRLNEVINHLKELKGIPISEPLPNGTPIISEIIRLENLQACGDTAV